MFGSWHTNSPSLVDKVWLNEIRSHLDGFPVRRKRMFHLKNRCGATVANYQWLSAGQRQRYDGEEPNIDPSRHREAEQTNRRQGDNNIFAVEIFHA